MRAPPLALVLALARLAAADRAAGHYVHDHTDADQPPAVVPQLNATAPARRRVEDTNGTNSTNGTGPLRVVFNTVAILTDSYACQQLYRGMLAIGTPANKYLPHCDDDVTDNCWYRCMPEDRVTVAMQRRLAEVLASTERWFAAAFTINSPVQHPLTSRSLSGTWCAFGGPVDYRLPNSGVKDADAYIVVTTRPTTGTQVAYGGACLFDSGYPLQSQPGSAYSPPRPVVGQVNLSPRLLGGDEAEWEGGARVEAVLSTTVHETLHALGFYYAKMSEFPCPQAPNWDRRANGYDGTAGIRPCSVVASREPVEERRTSYLVDGEEAWPACSSSTSHNPLSQPHRLHLLDRRMHQMTVYSKRVTTPNVIAHARAHFGCEPTSAQAADPLGRCHPTETYGCIDGMPLENGGDDGSAPAHWEERALHGEMMCASASSARPSPLSHITFGLFQDSGWYTPDYDVPDPICYYASPWLQHAAIGNAPGCRGDDGKPRPGRRAVWGAGRGCAFVSGRCNADPWHGYFCSDGSPTHRACTAGRLAVGSCSLTEFDKALPVAYRYFDESPKLGGADARLDYCPIVTSFRDYSCTHPPLAAPSEEEIDRRRARGERQCHDCRCFSSSLTSEAADAQEIDQVGCFEHRCLAPERLQIRIGDSDWQDCNGHGGLITLDDFDGELACPPASELCADAADLR